ncbi:hypothetical protein HDU81_008173 [Chytriomyces hyalinus]|nr:hypothetical protein HDU81_008173 [Chytriomyces hyalinus]
MTDATDASDATDDATEATDTSDATDATEDTDATDGTDMTDATDASDVADDATEATDATDATEATEATATGTLTVTGIASTGVQQSSATLPVSTTTTVSEIATIPMTATTTAPPKLFVPQVVNQPPSVLGDIAKSGPPKDIPPAVVDTTVQEAVSKQADAVVAKVLGNDVKVDAAVFAATLIQTTVQVELNIPIPVSGGSLTAPPDSEGANMIIAIVSAGKTVQMLESSGFETYNDLSGQTIDSSVSNDVDSGAKATFSFLVPPSFSDVWYTFQISATTLTIAINSGTTVYGSIIFPYSDLPALFQRRSGLSLSLTQGYVPVAASTVQQVANNINAPTSTPSSATSATGAGTGTATAAQSATATQTATAAQTATTTAPPTTKSPIKTIVSASTTSVNAAPPPNDPPGDVATLAANGPNKDATLANVDDKATIASVTTFASALLGGVLGGDVDGAAFAATLAQQTLEVEVGGEPATSGEVDVASDKPGSAIVAVVDAGEVFTFYNVTSSETYLGLAKYQIRSKATGGKAILTYFLPSDYESTWHAVEATADGDAKVSIFSGTEALGQVAFEYVSSATRKRDTTPVALIQGSVPLTDKQAANFNKGAKFPEYVHKPKGPTVEDYYLCRKAADTTQFLDIRYKPIWDSTSGRGSLQYLESLRNEASNILAEEYEYAAFSKYLDRLSHCLKCLPNEYNYFHDPNWKSPEGMSEWYLKQIGYHDDQVAGGYDHPAAAPVGNGYNKPAPPAPAFAYNKPDPVAYGYKKPSPGYGNNKLDVVDYGYMQPAATPAAAYEYNPVAYGNNKPAATPAAANGYSRRDRFDSFFSFRLRR